LWLGGLTMLVSQMPSLSSSNLMQAEMITIGFVCVCVCVCVCEEGYN